MTATDEGFWGTRDTDPKPYYRGLHEAGDEVVWDERLNAWLAISHKACRELLVAHDDKYATVKTDLLPPGKFVELQGGPSHLNFLKGADHKKLHRWWAAQFNQRRIDEIRQEVILPVLAENFAELDDVDEAELVTQLTNTIPVKVILALMDIPVTPERVEAALRVFKRRRVFMNALVADPTSALDSAIETTREIIGIVEPFLEARRDGTGDDFISAVWRDGPDLMEEFTIDEVRTQCVTYFTGAGDTMISASNNLLYYVATHPDLLARLRETDREENAGFIDAVVEETLRIFGPAHARERKAMADQELRGAKLHAGDLVLGLTGAAALDEAHYSDATEFDPARPSPRDHFSFSAGSRACVGAPLARAMLQELLAMTADKWRSLELDPDREQPTFTGFGVRSYQPLHVRLEHSRS